MQRAEELRIYAAEAKTKPDYTLTAPALLEKCRAFYQDPQNERAYQEWKAKRDAKTAKAVSA